ncbi:MAG: flagellar motor switch protein FliN [Planctomycetaceae bacterium]|nr:flagellar motor switch protein FliN [Planctomycetaceae bacterium]
MADSSDEPENNDEADNATDAVSNSAEEASAAESIAEQINSPAPTGGTEAHPVEFPQAARSRARSALPIERFADVSIELSVEIGRVTMPIGELLQLGEGAVVELERSVSEPVDVMAQGIRIASGEVVVIDDRFAVRITEIVNADEGRESGSRGNSERVLAAGKQ